MMALRSEGGGAGWSGRGGAGGQHFGTEFGVRPRQMRHMIVNLDFFLFLFIFFDERAI